MKTRLTKVLVLLAVIAALVATMAMPAAAVAVTGVSGVEVTVDSNGSINESDGTVTITTTGSFTAKKTTVITVTNTSGSTATISFDYEASNYNSFSLASSASGSYSKVMTAGDSITFSLQSKSGLGNKTATLKLSNFSVVTAAAESNVTVTYGSLGSVKLDGATVASGSVNSVSSSTGASFVAVPGSGSKFVGWINPATNAVLSTSATYQLIPTEDAAIRAVFANASASPVFYADGTAKLFESLDAALTYASSASNKVITLASDGTLAAGNYTIPAGVTLQLPYNAENTLCAEQPSIAFVKGSLGSINGTAQYTAPTVYRTLNMANGASITVNGAISLSGTQSPKYGYNGMPSGPLPFIKMASDSQITVANGGFLYAWGYITGSGSVEVKSGGTVYECFQIADYRGGQATTDIVGEATTCGVFPFNQYYVQNVEVPMTLNAGAKELGYTSLTVTGLGVESSDVPFIGADNSMFVIDSGKVVKDYMENTGRLSVTVNGNIVISSIQMSMKVAMGKTLDINSNDYVLPIAQHLTISVESGTISMDQSVALLPGSELYIREGAICQLGSGKKIIVYDLDQWLYNDGANGYSGTTNLPYMQAKYVPGGNGTTGRLKDALVQVDGTVNASSGALYVTEGGANIYSTGTGVIKTTPGTETITYQVITNDTAIGSWPEITIKPAVLKDADGATVSADVAGDYTYYASTGRWDKPGHFYEDTVVAPTCTEAGYTKHTCAVCGNSYNDTEVAANGHSYDDGVVTAPTCITDGYTTYTCSVCGHSYQGDIVECPGAHDVVTVAGKAATCTETGLTDGYVCDRCGEVMEAQEVIPALGHTEVIDAAKAATCTDTGLTEGKHCSACGEVLVAQVETPALGHKEVTDAAVAATCTATGLTEGKHCSVCGEVILAQEETPALGHKEVIDAAVAATCTTTGLTEGKHCSVCGEVLVAQNEIAALGHKEVIDAAVAATCTTTGLTEGKHCSVCGEVLVAQETVSALGHSWSDWAVTEPTYQKAGEKTRSCSACGETETEQIAMLEDPVSAWGISLHDNIGVRFALKLAEGDTVAITVNGETADVVEDENGYYCVYVAAAQMTDKIAISVNNLPLAKTYSVREYADKIISGDYDDATKNLVKYMLVYGGAAQNYFVYNNAPENLASNGITVDSTAVPGEAPNAQTVAGKISGVKFYGASLVYRNKIAVRFYFTGDVSELTFTVNGESQKVIAAEEKSYVEIANILPQDLDEQITLTVSNGTDNLTVTYGPLNYIVRMNEKGSENLQALVLAMYNYYLAAEAYSIDN